MKKTIVGMVVAVLAVAVWAMAPALPFQLISKSTVSYHSKANFPVTSPELRPDRQTNSLSTQVVEDVHLLALAGPESNMMSFQIGTMTNPEIRLPVGARLTINVVNVDDDMVHDLYLTSVKPPYPQAVHATPVGSAVLRPYKGKDYSGAVLILKATHAGTVYYVCTVPGHAKAGMWGKIVVTN